MDDLALLHDAVKNSDVDLVATLLSRTPKVAYFGKYGDSALTYASGLGNVAIVDLLINHMLRNLPHSTTPEATSEDSPRVDTSTSATFTGDLAPWDITEKVRFEFSYAFLAALLHNHMDICDLLLTKYKVDITKCYTPAHFSLLINVCGSNVKEEDEWVDLISTVVSGARSASILESDKPAIYAKRLTRMYHAAEWLLSRGIDVNLPCDYGYTPLSMACAFGYTDIAGLLLSHRAEPVFGAETFYHPVVNAIRKKDTRLIELLLEARCDPNILIEEEPTVRYSALQLAEKQGNADIAALLRKYGATG